MDIYMIASGLHNSHLNISNKMQNKDTLILGLPSSPLIPTSPLSPWQMRKKGIKFQ